MSRWLSVAVLCFVGCSGPEPSVTGVVSLDGKPLPDAYVSFFPEGATEGLGGHGRTDAAGKYVITPSRGKRLDPGPYKVTVRRPLNPDGTPGDPNIPEMDSPAKESLPAVYSQRDLSRLTAEVSPQSLAHDLSLDSKPK